MLSRIKPLVPLHGDFDQLAAGWLTSQRTVPALPSAVREVSRVSRVSRSGFWLQCTPELTQQKTRTAGRVDGVNVM
jgi:hypothetical protein